MLPLFHSQGVYHAAGLGGPWYGSDNVIDSVRTRVVHASLRHTQGRLKGSLKLASNSINSLENAVIGGLRRL